MVAQMNCVVIESCDLMTKIDTTRNKLLSYS